MYSKSRTIRMLTQIINTFLLGVFLSGCVTALSATGEKVRVTSNTAVVQDCTFLGELKGSDHIHGGVLGGIAEENAYNRLKNKAGKIGADIVLTTAVTFGLGGGSIRGEAYQCESK